MGVGVSLPPPVPCLTVQGKTLLILTRARVMVRHCGRHGLIFLFVFTHWQFGIRGPWYISGSFPLVLSCCLPAFSYQEFLCSAGPLGSSPSSFHSPSQAVPRPGKWVVAHWPGIAMEQWLFSHPHCLGWGGGWNSRFVGLLLCHPPSSLWTLSPGFLFV